MSLAWPFKDPNEVLDYDVDWSARLGVNETISSSSWAIATGTGTLTMDSTAFSNTATKVWLSAGAEGESYLLTNRIITNGARTMDQSVKLKIKAK